MRILLPAPTRPNQRWSVEGPIREAGAGELALVEANLRAMQSLEVVPSALRGLFRAHMETAIERLR